MLTYKANWYGREIIEIDRWYPSSKLCSNCGNKNNKLTLKDRSWVCPECNTVHNRDYNAAINIRKEGERILSIKENKINKANNEINNNISNNLLVSNINKDVLVGLSSPEFTLEDYPTMDDRLRNEVLKSSDRLIQEKNDFIDLL